MAITEPVQVKLDQNIQEGFAQFEKVQQHSKNAEEQLREAGALGHSIKDRNNLPKLPHLRGQFGKRAWNGSSLTSCPRLCSRCGHRRARAEDAPTPSSISSIASCRSTPSSSRASDCALRKQRQS
jgi:hypothetical protein